MITRTSIVIPCLNEEEFLTSTCNSLGFGLGEKDTPPDIWLILVDNDSEDRTWELMAQIRERSALGSVLTIREPVRGYVPARHAGVIAARQLADRHLMRQEELLVLQSDADTRYSEGYVAAMRAAATNRSNFFLQGTSYIPPEFAKEYPQYMALSQRADAPIQHLWRDEADDVIVGDSVSGYLLSDYFRWGGHVREFSSLGTEILAESSRLFIKAKLSGGMLVSVPHSVAHHSKRKTIADPISQFVTAGFPREKEWYAAWRQSYCGPSTLEELKRDDIDEKVRDAIFLRQAHSLILFGLLPAYVAAFVDEASASHRLSRFHQLFEFMDGLSKQETINNTAVLFERAFNIIDRHAEALRGCLSCQ